MKEELLIKYSNVKKKTLCEKILNKKTHYSDLLDRTIVSNNPDEEIGNNKISSSKYNLISFPIFNLLQQFTKPSNLYFLLIGVLQMVPAISVSEGKPTMFFPLTIVILVSMIKDFVQDWKRHMSDKRQNESQVQILNQLGYSVKKWQDILVGNIIKIKKDEYFPCDILLLKHSNETSLAYVETKNLDGETNLKLRKVPQCLNFLQKEDVNEIGNLQIQVSYEKPNPFLSSFNGNLKTNNKKYPLQPNNVILRGCSLKINSYAIGLCLYNGHQTKLMLNGGQSQSKRSSLQNILNTYFKYICVFQILVTFLSAIIYGVIVSLNYQNLGYIDQSPYFLQDTIFTWGSWFINFSNFIPISLLVTVELVRYGQGYLLNQDQKCKTKGFNVQVQTSSVNEELGQIQYLLSDKTGTLTQNLMQFKCLSVNGTSYGGSSNKQEDPRQSMLTQEESMGPALSTNPLQNPLKEKQKYVDFPEQQKQKLIYDLRTNEKISEHQRQKLNKSLLHLSLCHNVIKEEDGYTSSSPDELALVSFAKHIGFTFIQKDDNNIIKVLVQTGQEQHKLLKFKLLHVLQFTSERKRMSVVLEDEGGKILLLCKGADDVIMQRSAIKQIQQQMISQELYNYAFQGLRTLLLSEKEIDVNHYKDWQRRYSQAITIVGSERMEKIYDLQSQIERGLTVLGVTAIEDKLQDEVKQTIEGIKKSGVKVWMLTGDKKETAVSIGYSCGLIDETCQKITLDCEPQHADKLICNVQSMMHLIKGQKITIVSGQVMKKIKDQTMEKLQKLLKGSSSVICCRVSPKDKETLTALVKKWGRTLAVGDGANDVNMINAANVGVGVRGIEGSQATRASDYVISEFKILKRLILYHGLNFYNRNAYVTVYTLYKNILITLPILAYGPLSMESGTYIYETWIFQFFNIFYCSLPIMLFGLFNVKYSQKQLQKHPIVYCHGQQNKYFNKSILLRLVFTTISFGALIVYVVFFATSLTIQPQGLMAYEIWSGMLIFNIVVVSINIRILIVSDQWSPLLVLTCIAGIVSYYLVFLFVQIVLYTDCKDTLINQLGNAQFWILLITLCIIVQGYQWGYRKYESANQELEIEQYEGQKLNEEKQQQQLKKSLPFIKKKSSKHSDPGSPVKIKDISGNDVAGGYAFAEDQQRSLHFI